MYEYARLRVPVTTEKMGQLIVEIFAHGLKLWPVDRECKEEENRTAYILSLLCYLRARMILVS